jgi:hypothetical protein
MHDESTVQPGTPRPLLADVHAKIVAGLRAAPEHDLLREAAAMQLLSNAATASELVSLLADVQSPFAPFAIRLLHRSNPSVAPTLALELMAALDVPFDYAEAVHHEITKRSEALAATWRSRRFLAWTPTPELPPWRWESRLFVDAFPTSFAIENALAPPGALDGVGALALPLLYSAKTGTPDAVDYATTARLSSLRAPDQSRALRQAAGEVVEASADGFSIAVLATFTRRKWLSFERMNRAVDAVGTLEARLEALEYVVGPALFPRELVRCEEAALAQITALSDARYAPAIPMLTFLAKSGDRLLSHPAAAALTAFGTDDARDALGNLLPEIMSWPDRSRHSNVLALRARAGADLSRSTETLADLFTDAALSTREGRHVATQILMHHTGFGPNEPLFEADSRWLDAVARLLDGPLDEIARGFLGTFDKNEVRAALARIGYTPPARPPSRRHRVPSRPRWIERYENGDHEEVWAEIVALEDSVRDRAVFEQAMSVAKMMMSRVRTNLERIAVVLAKAKYAFAAKTAKKALALPDAKHAAHIKSLERGLGATLPISLRAFWEVVGSVDFTETSDAPVRDTEFHGWGSYDPIMIARPKLALDLLKPRVLREKSLPRELQRPIRAIAIGLDPRTKADPEDSNEAPYEIDVLGSHADAVLRQGERSTLFVEYLRTMIASGGFLALDKLRNEERLRGPLVRNFVPF